MAIRGFKHNGLKRFFESCDVRRIPQQHKERIAYVLRALDRNDPLKTLNALPGLRLHPLKGDRKSEWAVRLSGNCCITFRIEDGKAYDVDLIDYH